MSGEKIIKYWLRGWMGKDASIKWCPPIDGSESLMDLEAADNEVICAFEAIGGKGAGEEVCALLKEYREQGCTEPSSFNFEGVVATVRLGSQVVWSSIRLPLRLFMEDGGLTAAGNALATEIMDAVSTILHEDAEFYDLRDVQGVAQMALTDALTAYALARRAQVGSSCRVVD